VIAAFRECAACHQILPRSEFRLNPKLKDGLHSWYRRCCRERRREWRHANPEAVAGENERRRVPPVEHSCLECGAKFTGPAHKKLCGRRSCKDKRYARAHPEQVRAKEQRKRARRQRRPRPPARP
jgi:hypothetical protein